MIGAHHIRTAENLVIGAPVLGTPALTQVHFNGRGGLQIDASKVFIVTEDNKPGPPPAPPKLAEFFLVACARSKNARAAVGDLCEIYVRDCVQYGLTRARLRFWARTAQFTLPVLARAIGRAAKWAALVDILRRHFTG
jgi:hypothetical protein